MPRPVVVEPHGARRTGVPSSLRRLWILVAKEIRGDLHNSADASKFAVRILLGSLFVALYGFSYISAYNEHGDNASSGGQLLSSASYPQAAFSNGLADIADSAILFAGADSAATSDLAQEMVDLGFVTSAQVAVDNETTSLEGLESLLEGTASPENFTLGLFVTQGTPAWAYTIFVNGSSLPDPLIGTSSSTSFFSSWVQSRVLSAQYAADQSIASLEGTTTSSAGTLVTNVQGLPESGGNDIDVTLVALPGLYILLGTQFALNLYLVPMMRDKRKGVVRGLVLMGVPETVYYNHWVVYHVIDGACIAGLMTAFFFAMRYVVLANGFFVFFPFWLFMIGTSQFAVLITHVVESEVVASITPFFTWLFVGGISTVLILSDVSQTVFGILTFLHPWFGVYQSSSILIRWDWAGKDLGVVASTAVESGIVGVIGAQIGQLILYELIIAHIFRPARSRKQPLAIPNELSEDDLGDRPEFEALPQQAEPLLRIRDLRKEFRTGAGCCGRGGEVVKAVNGLDMTVLKGEIFGFLGHNSSGKTTTLKMIAGEYLPSGGAAELHFSQGTFRIGAGADEEIRNRIGVCAQEDLLFEDMTCRENLRLFTKLKGGIPCADGESESEAIEAEVQRRIDQVNFTTSADVDKPVGTYSGGMKRKVSIAIAFLGNPELVMLDEPTAGVDSYGRRAIWDMIAASKEGRSIILTTHFMDEADVLSDRIGILNHGKLVTCGTSLFLKHHFGAGYTLKFDAADETALDQASRIVRESVPQAEFKYLSHLTQHWTLPSGVEASFAGLLDALDTRGYTSVSLELTTLTEVFLKTGAESSLAQGGDLATSDQADKDGVLADEEDEAGENAPHEVVEVGSLAEKIRLIWTDPRTVDTDDGTSLAGEPETVPHWKKVLAISGALFKQSNRSIEFMIFSVGMPVAYIIVAFTLAYVFVGNGDTVTVPPLALDGAAFFSATGITQDGTAVVFDLPNMAAGSQAAGNGNELTFIDSTPTNADDLSWYMEQGLMAGGYLSTNSTLMYNGSVSVALPLMYSLLSNASLASAGASVYTEIRGLPYVAANSDYNFAQFMLALFIGFGFISLGYLVISLAEFKEARLYTFARLHGIQRLHVFAGSALNGVVVSWLPFFIFTLIMAFSFKNPIVGSGGRGLAFFVLCVTYVFAMIPFGFIFEPLFPTAESARNWVPTIMIFLLAGPFAIYGTMPIYTTASAQQIMGDVMSILPGFAFQRGLSELFALSDAYDDPSLSWADTWSLDARISYSILLLIASGCMYWIVVLLQVRHANYTAVPGSAVGITPEDPDVLHEREMAMEGVAAGDKTLRVKDIVKHFLIAPNTLLYRFRYLTVEYWLRRLFARGKDPFASKCTVNEAVKGISFSVANNEIFALLGPNGSGKSVTASAVLRDLPLDGGSVAIDGVPLSDVPATERLYAQGRVAYCPQHDAIFSKLTVAEHVGFVLDAHGLDKKDPRVAAHVNAVLDTLNLTQHIKKLATNLSGGYKRRFCLALALLDKADIMLIDEVSSGIDPAGRLQIWDVLKPELAIHDEHDAAQVQDLRLPGVLLSTHYMDEAQALASKIGIMVNGAMHTVGSLDRLREKHCNKIFADLTFHDTVEDPETVPTAFAKAGFDAVIVETFSNRLKLQINLEEGNLRRQSMARVLASAFRFTESAKARLNIALYSLAVMDLEKIFIELSKQQFDRESGATSLP